MNGNRKTRPVDITIRPHAVVEGAGVKLRRSLPYGALDYLDPFLLLDHFGSDNPDDYLAGFPMHPHRGIETVTYMLAGSVHHRDSIGNAGAIAAGDVQWMTAGRGILHEAMPRPVDNRMAGFQLWVNLPAKLKMTAPRYQEFPASRIPAVRYAPDVLIRVIAGQVAGIRGPVVGIAADPTYLDVTVPAGSSFDYPTEPDHTAFAYVFEGCGRFDEISAEHPTLVVFGKGEIVTARAAERPLRFLLVTGRPLGEPVARYGPFVMSTQEEIRQALRDLREGTFVR